jgi:hypothetical protein
LNQYLEKVKAYPCPIFGWQVTTFSLLLDEHQHNRICD